MVGRQTLPVTDRNHLSVYHRLLDGYWKVTGDSNLRGLISWLPAPGYDW
jgi:hypothetical protein